MEPIRRGAFAVALMAGLACVILGAMPAVARQQTPTAAPMVAAPPIGGGQYSPQMQMYFQLVPYYGAYGARLTAPPLPSSPLRQQQIQLEQGDMITHLDGYPLSSANQLETHHSQTSVTFVNWRTNQAETRWVTLPPPGFGPGPGPFPPGPYPPPAPMMLGVNGVSVSVPNPGVAAAAAPGYPAPAPPMTTALRITSVSPGSPAAAAGLQPGDTILTAGTTSIADINGLRFAIANSGGVLPMTVMNAYGSVRNATAYMGGVGAAATYGP